MILRYSNLSDNGSNRPQLAHKRYNLFQFYSMKFVITCTISGINCDVILQGIDEESGIRKVKKILTSKC